MFCIIILMLGSVASNNSLQWYKEMNPGMMLKIDKKSVGSMKSVISWFLPWYIDLENMLGLPKNYTWKIGDRW